MELFAKAFMGITFKPNSHVSNNGNFNFNFL